MSRAWLSRWRGGAAALSAILLACAFPPIGAAACAWVALVPLMIIARFSTPRVAFRWGYWAGFGFWMVSLGWLRRLARFDTALPVVWCGWVALAAYCALYVAAFTAVASLLWRGERAGEPEGRLAALWGMGRMMLLAVLWTGFEYLRATLFSGFAWNGLGISQYRNLALIQMAEWGGVYAVSAVLVLLNAALAITWMDLVRVGLRGNVPARRWHPELLLALAFVLVACSQGIQRIKTLRAAERDGSLTPVRCALVIADVPQDEKWSDALSETIRQRFTDLTERVGLLAPDLVIWPETAVPMVLDLQAPDPTFINALAASAGPLLVGAIEVDLAGEQPRYYNSACLYASDGSLAGAYRKQHLVPFGEYVPLSGLIPALERLAPLGYSCAAGQTGTVFRLETPAVPFATLICFEDVMDGLARRAVENGARLLVNQTNDAWFEETSAALQHMSHCVFRCIENRVPAVRCANRGVSCRIDWTGALDPATRRMLEDDEETLSLFRMEIAEVPLGTTSRTFFNRHGNWPFAIPSAVVALLGLVLAWRERRPLN